MPLASQISGSVVRRVDFIRITFLATPAPVVVGFNSGDRTYVHEGTTYAPSELGAITNVKHSTDLKSQPFEISLNPFNQTVLENLKVGRHYSTVEYYMGFVDEEHELIQDVFVLRAYGYLSSGQITLSRNSKTLNISLENRLIEGRRRNGIIAEDSHQRARYPNDSFARHVHTMAERAINWGGRESTGSRGVGGGSAAPIIGEEQQR